MLKGYVLKNCILITPFKLMEERNVVVRGSKISSIFRKDIYIDDSEELEVIDLEGRYYVSPGFIDIHTHGGDGQDCLCGDNEKISKFKVKSGVTGYLSTIVSAPLELIYKTFELISEFKKHENSIGCSKILGIHLEGPYLSINYKGAHQIEYLRNPKISECKELLTKAKGMLKIVTLAPELDEALKAIRFFTSHNVVCSAGHSNASPSVLKEAIRNGLSHVTHLFNAHGILGFKELGVRDPGFEGYVLYDKGLKAEIIGETTHVDPVMMELAYRTKGPENIIIITDSSSVSGLEPGRYKIGVMDSIIDESSDVARLPDGGLAGSTITLNKAAKTFLENTSASLCEVIRMITYNPAYSLGISYCKGSIEIGKDADLVVFDKNFDVKKVFVEGRLVFDLD